MFYVFKLCWNQVCILKASTTITKLLVRNKFSKGAMENHLQKIAVTKWCSSAFCLWSSKKFEEQHNIRVASLWMVWHWQHSHITTFAIHSREFTGWLAETRATTVWISLTTTGNMYVLNRPRLQTRSLTLANVPQKSASACTTGRTASLSVQFALSSAHAILGRRPTAGRWWPGMTS